MTFVWRLPALLAERHVFSAVVLQQALAESGVALSRHAVFRLISKTPQRLELTTFVALCRLLKCTPSDLIGIGEAPVDNNEAVLHTELSMPPAFWINERSE